MKKLVLILGFVGLLLQGCGCGANHSSTSRLNDISDETSAANLPAGSVFYLQNDVNLLPWTTFAYIKNATEQDKLEVWLYYPRSGSDRTLNKATTMTVIGMHQSNSLHIEVETASSFKLEIMTSKDVSYPTIGELKRVFERIEIPSGPTPVQ